MHIVRFEPGDGTAYLVLLHKLNDMERHHVQGLSAGAVLFGFNSESRPLLTFAFQDHGYMDFSYFYEKLYVEGAISQYSLVAAFYALEALLPYRTFGGVPDTFAGMPDDKWDAGWQLQLESLLTVDA